VDAAGSVVQNEALLRQGTLARQSGDYGAAFTAEAAQRPKCPASSF